MAEPERLIRAALPEIQELIARACASVGGVASPGSALDQLGLTDGDRTVLEYIEHGECGVAIEHLIYMAYEPALPLARATFRLIEEAGRAMKMDPKVWEKLRAQIVDR